MPVLGAAVLLLSQLASPALAANATIASGLVGAGQPTAPRVALVIGNSGYKGAPLKNPLNDAADMAKELQRLGFRVILRRNASQREMKSAIREFSSELKRAQVGLFYFAGHGLQVRGNNYLVPVGNEIDSEADAEDLSVDANYVLQSMEESRVRVSIVILDACRNNPFSRGFRSSSRGLAQMSAPTGSLIAFATAPGSVAADGTGRNGLYTQHLLDSLRHPNSDILKVFQRVRASVVRDSQGRQTPWESVSLVGDFYFSPVGVTESDAPRQEPDGGQIIGDTEAVAWTRIASSQLASDFVSFLSRFPNGQFAERAKAELRRREKVPAQDSGAPDPEARDGRSCDFCPEMVSVPGRNFEIGKFEVTQAQWRAVMGSNPSQFPQCGGDCPVEQISWLDIQAYLKRLNEMTGKHFRLPEDSEWEHACHGMSVTEYCGSSDVEGVGWYERNSSGTTHSVGMKGGNAIGLFDMTGNVWEWTDSCWQGDCSMRVIRGGAWSMSARDSRSAGRYWANSGSRDQSGGFRIVRSLSRTSASINP